MVYNNKKMQKGNIIAIVDPKDIKRILFAPDLLTVCCSVLALSLLSSQAIIFPSPLMSAARWTVLFPGAAHASIT
jgi:hypothetical protein